jgi:DeoR/GlpR family transcriptional regulator of sugar metabolism
MRLKKNELEERLNRIRSVLKRKEFLNIEELSKLTNIPRSTVSRYIYKELRNEVEIKSYGNVVLIRKK